MHTIPVELLQGPFTREAALGLGLTPRVLEGCRFARIHPRVYRHRDHVLTFDETIQAARLALPPDARTTGITRLQRLGLDHGPRSPVRFVMAGDHHLAIEGIFLHRTVLMPPCDEQDVTPLAAFVSWCSTARVIDAVKVGDWLVHRGHLDLDALRDFLDAQPWRSGAAEAAWVLGLIDGRSRSLPESEVRCLVCFAGLPVPELNIPIDSSEEIPILPDLWYEQWRVAVEYEGGQHQEDRGQYTSDIDRYAVLRRRQVRYVQVTRERLATPRIVVGEIYRELREAGYAGPPPAYGEQWRLLFARLSDVVLPSGRRAVS